MSEQPSELEIQLMREALALAATARGDVEPNPMVGCIIQRDGRVIGRGFHRRFGERHAEPDALANCSEDPRGATAVVTLEPCCHTNKKTPPCVPVLLSAGISRVVVGQVDPNPSVCGQGISQLQQSGVRVVTGVLERECQQLNAPFYSLTTLHRPYVTLKWAESADGLVGGAGNTPRRISGPESSRLVHMLRSRCDAILVSADTVIADDPALTVRNVPIKRTPMRIVIDTHLRTPPTAHVVESAGGIPTHIFTTVAPQLSYAPATVHQVPPDKQGHASFAAILRWLGEQKCTHLLVESGPRLATSLMAAGMVDRAWLIRSRQPLREANAPHSPEMAWPAVATRELGGDTVSEHLNRQSACYFAPEPSPDFVMDLG